MIKYFKEENIFKLDTPSTSYVMGVFDGYLGHIYYGKKIISEDSMSLAALKRTTRFDENPKCPSLDIGEKAGFLNSFPFEFPTAGIGDFKEPCIDIEDEYGQNGLDLKYNTYSIKRGKPALQGLPYSFESKEKLKRSTWAERYDDAVVFRDNGDSFTAPDSIVDTLEIVLTDDDAGIAVALYYSVFNDLDIITRSVKVKNASHQTKYLTRILSGSITFDQGGSNLAKHFKVLSMPGAWARERNIKINDITNGSFTTESLKGESAHSGQPANILVSGNADYDIGEVYLMHLVYSGNFLSKTTVDENNSLRAVLGIHPYCFKWRLESGDFFQAPEVVCTYSDEGLGKMSRTLHDFYREHLIRSGLVKSPRPMLINNWEATYFNFDDEKLIQIANEASRSGIDLLVIDDGWYGNRNSDEGSLGDWYVNEEKIKCGLKEFSAKIASLHMKLGIWFEPEMVSPDSVLLNEHPDWVLRTKNREPNMARNQYLLDFSNIEVITYIENRMDAIIDEGKLSYVKWDMNRSITDIGSAFLPKDRQGELYHRHVLGLYEIQEHLIRKHPDLLLENCSSGGARFDPGMLFYSPQIWCSDDMDPVERARTYEGTELLYPVSSMGAHVCKTPNDITGRNVPFATRAISAMQGTFGFELDISSLSETEKSEIAGFVFTYRDVVSPLVLHGDYYRIAALRETGDFDAVELLSKDKKEGVIFTFETLFRPSMRSRKIYLKGLNADASYEIYRINFQGFDREEFEGQDPNYEAQKIEIFRASGDVLMNSGFMLQRPKGDFIAELFAIMQI